MNINCAVDKQYNDELYYNYWRKWLISSDVQESATIISTDFSLQRAGCFCLLGQASKDSQPPTLSENESLVTLLHFGRMSVTISLMVRMVSATRSSFR